MFIHPILLHFSKLGLDRPRCSLPVFCEIPKLFEAMKAIQILLIIALGKEDKKYELNPSEILFYHPM
jgi:hypothetical protein